MGVTTIDSNNAITKYVRQITKEYVRENLFSPYMGTAVNSIIRIRSELTPGGKQVNIPLVTKLTGRGKGSGTLVGNEEKIDNYGMSVWVDWARDAVVITKAENRQDEGLAFGEAKPLLSDWGKERQRDDVISALMSLPSESAPTGLGSDDGETVNGIRYEDATAAQRNTWNAANSDRVLYGAAVSNYNATHATALATIDTTNDRFVKASLKLLKRIARNASPKIRPFKVKSGREYFVAFAGTNTFRDMSDSLESINTNARAREDMGMDNNPLFQDGDLLYNGVIIREVPEISDFVTDVWTSLTTAGDSSSRVEPVFLCGQSAAALAWGQEPKPTKRKEDDYGFIDGVGIEMCYGTAKVFKKHPMDGTNLVQWGVATGFFSAPLDA